MRDGTLSLRLAGRVNEIHGIDFAAGMIEVAQRKATESGVDNARFMQATIFDPQLEKGSDDAVLAWGILHLVDDRKLVMKRINELLKPGGAARLRNRMHGREKDPDNVPVIPPDEDRNFSYFVTVFYRC